MNAKKVLIVILLSLTSYGFGEDFGPVIVQALNASMNGEMEKAAQLMRRVGNIQEPYWQARAAIMYGILAEATGNLEEAERQYTMAGDIARSALGLSETADGYAISSEAASRLMLIKGIAYIIRNAPVAERYAKKALEIDPANITAKLVFAQGKVNAPRLFGGDVDLGIEVLEDVLRGETEPSQRFTAYYALSLAWEKKRAADKAVKMIENALGIFPANPEALAQKARLQKN